MVPDPWNASQPPRKETLRIEYIPRPGLLSMCFVNFLLGLLTLSIYRFWARTNVRKHIWSCVHINGEPLEYTGRGIELFKGALFVFVVFGLPAVLLIAGISIAYGPEHPAIGAVQTLFLFIVSLLWGAAVFRARRYQLSRTQWRGIRGWLEGSATTYSLLYFGSLLARGMTLGWITPVMSINLQEKMLGGMRFGSMPFRFKGRAGPLYPAYAISWFLTFAVFIGIAIALGAAVAFLAGDDLSAALGDFFAEKDQPTEEQAFKIGVFFAGIAAFYLLLFLFYPIVWSIYAAREMAVLAGYTSIGDARFRLRTTTGSMIGLTIGNILIWVFTLGIGGPYVNQRLVRYLCDRMEIDGKVDVDNIRQSTAPLSTMGEGLADALDVGGL